MISKILLFLIVACSFGGCDEPPNIIVFVVDDWGFNDVGWHYNTNTETPFLTELATTEGLIISSHYTAPYCSPSRAALLTGRYHTRYGLQTNVGSAKPFGVSLSEKFLSEEFSNNGYSTHAIGKWHLGFSSWQYTPTYRYFDTFSGYYQGQEHYWTHIHENTKQSISGIDLRINELPAAGYDNIYGVYWQKNQLIKLLSDIKQKENNQKIENIENNDSDNVNNPFFIYCAWQSSHVPSEAPDNYMNKYLDSASTDSRRAFQAQTTLLDDTMNIIVNTLKNDNLWDNTLIIFFSDNGAGTDKGDNAPLRGAKNTAWEGGVRTPTFITGGYLNSNQYGKTITQPFFHVTDWYPTLLAAAQIQPSKDELDGRNMWNVIQSNIITEDDIYREFLLHIEPTNCEVDTCGAYIFSHFKLIWGTTVVTGDTITYHGCYWTRDNVLIEDNDILGCNGIIDVDVTCNCQDNPCLFDLANDPCEYNDVSDNNEYYDIYQYMLAQLQSMNSTQAEPLDNQYESQWELVNPDLYDGFWTPYLAINDSNELRKSQTDFDFETFLENDKIKKIGKNEEYLDMANQYRDSALLKAKETTLFVTNNNDFDINFSKNIFPNFNFGMICLIFGFLLCLMIIGYFVRVIVKTENRNGNSEITEATPLIDI